MWDSILVVLRFKCENGPIKLLGSYKLIFLLPWSQKEFSVRFIKL